MPDTMIVPVLSELVPPAPIKITNYDEILKKVQDYASMFDGVEISEEQEKEARAYLAELRGAQKSVDQRRIEVKKFLDKPYDAFKADCDTIKAALDPAIETLKTQVDEFEVNRKRRKEADLSAYYEDYAPLLVPVVPYSRLHDESWLKKTVNLVKAQDELKEKVDTIAGDLGVIESTCEPYADECKSKYLDTLSLSVAITEKTRLAEHQKRVDELKQQQEELARKQAEETVKPVMEVAPEPVEKVSHKPAPAASAHAAAPVQSGVRDVVMELYGTTAEDRTAVAALLDERGIEYKAEWL